MGRIRQLDGLRGIAVLLVLIAHLAGGVSPHHRPFIAAYHGNGGGGGLVGVQLFFVLSGFLITSILLGERNRTGKLDFKAFYIRRVRRLVPALVTVSVIVAVGQCIAHPHRSLKTIVGTLRVLAYTSNLHLPILNRIPINGWLAHTWSLSVEEQFYLGWPITMFVLYRIAGRKGVAWGAGIGVALTILARAVLPAAPNIEYEMLRWDALLLGCLIAAWPFAVPRIAAWAGALTIAFYVFYLPQPAGNLDFVVTAAASAAVLIRARQVNWLKNPVLVHFGLISYGLYLWHVTVLRLGWPGPISLVLSIALAEISYRVVEQPFLRKKDANGAETRVVWPAEAKATEAKATEDAVGSSARLSG